MDRKSESRVQDKDNPLKIYVVVQFYAWLKFYCLLFLRMVVCDNKLEQILNQTGLRIGKYAHQYSALLKSTGRNYYSNLISQCAGDPEKLFEVINLLCDDATGSNLPDHDNPVQLQNNFGKYFVTLSRTLSVTLK